MQPVGPQPIFSWELEDGTIISLEPKEEPIEVPNSLDFLPKDHLYVVINSKVETFVKELRDLPGYPVLSEEDQQKVIALTKELKDVLNNKSECDFDDQYVGIKEAYDQLREQETKAAESKKKQYDEQVKRIEEDSSLDSEQKRVKKINAQIEMNFNPLSIATCGYGGLLKKQEKQNQLIKECFPLLETICEYKNNPDNTYQLSSVSNMIKACAALMRIPALVVSF